MTAKPGVEQARRLSEVDSGWKRVARSLCDNTLGKLAGRLVQVQIRTATLADAEELRDYAVRLFAEGLPGIFKRPDPTLEEERHAGTLLLSVASSHRGHGIGTALVEALIAWAPTAGVSRIQAWAWANNPGSIALYERLGFEREGLCRHAIVSDGESVDVVLLARLLVA